MAINDTLSYKLKDQTCVRLSLVGPADRNRFLNGFERISTRTNINRFLTFKKRFTEEELRYLLVIDNIDHLAIGAIDCNKPDIGIGLARYVRLKNTPDMAEAAIIIIDEYQGKGLGYLLYEKLMQLALENNIRCLHNIVGKDNKGMLGLLNKLGARMLTEQEDSYEYIIDITEYLRKAS